MASSDSGRVGAVAGVGAADIDGDIDSTDS